MIVLLVAALLVAGSTTACSVWEREVPGQAAPVDLVHPPAGPLDRAEPLTDPDLAVVSPEQLLDESVVAIVTQPVLHVRMESAADLPSYLSGGDYRSAISDGGIDFRSNEMAYYQVDGFTTICDGGKRYLLDPYDNEWLDSDGCAINAGDGGARNTLKISGYVVRPADPRQGRERRRRAAAHLVVPGDRSAVAVARAHAGSGT
jgi:hypothetical protein